MEMGDYLDKYAGLRQLTKAIKIAVKKGSVKDGALVGGAVSTPAAALAGGSFTTMPAHLQKGSVIAATGIVGGSMGAGALINTGVQAKKILRRAKNIKSAKGI